MLGTGLVLLSIILPIIVAELGLRLFLSLRQKPSFYRDDPVTGWAPMESVSYSGKLTSLSGRSYNASYSTNNIGLRELSSQLNNSPFRQRQHTILAIGDSFTGDFFSSNDDAWFGRIQQNLSVPVYAYGMGGSGTYQQYLAFRRLYPIVKPSILIIQFCTNDISNDSLKHSYYSIVFSQDLRRPYNISGKSYFRNDLIAKLYRALYSSSKLFKRLDSRVQGVLYKINNGYSMVHGYKLNAIEASAIATWKNNYRQYVEYARSVGVKSIWSVSCASALEPSSKRYVDIWRQESEELGVIPLQSFADSFYKASLNGEDVFYSDGGHLNDYGNKLAGDALSREITNKSLLK